MSRKARSPGARLTTEAGISPLTIRQKMQSVIRASDEATQPARGRARRGRERGGLEPQDLPPEPHGPEARPARRAQLRVAEAALGAHQHGERTGPESGGWGLALGVREPASAIGRPSEKRGHQHGRVDDGGPCSAALLHRLERATAEPLELCGPNPGGDAHGALGLERKNLSDPQLRRFLNQPAEAIPVAGADRESKRRRPGHSLRPLDQDLDRISAAPQHAVADQSRTVPEPDTEHFAGAADAKMVDLLRRHRYDVAGSQLPRRQQHRDHPRRAATAHQPVSTVSSARPKPAPTSTGRNTSASSASIPANTASPPGARAAAMAGSSRVLTLRRMLETSNSHGPRRGARSAASPSRNVTRSATPLRSALRAATSLASASISTPVARAAPSATAAIATIPLPLPRS